MKLLLFAIVGAVGMSSTARGEALVALTATNQLIRFDSASPGVISSTVSVTGLTAGDVIAGIDVRPATNVLYAFATGAGAGRVYSINLGTGAAALSATLTADAADTTAPFPFASVTGTFFGVDFNPVADRLRVVSDTGQNLRINVTSGATQLDVPVAYAAADANANTPPAVVASAYTNSFAGAMSTLLLNLDSSISTLVTQDPPNTGTLNTRGLTSAIVSPDATFDISGQTGVGYAVLDGVTLLTVNLSDGTTTEVGVTGAAGSITSVAVLGVPEPGVGVMLATAALALLASRRQKV